MKCIRCDKEMFQARIGKWEPEAEFGLNLRVDDCNGYIREFGLCKKCADSFEKFLMFMPKEGIRD